MHVSHDSFIVPIYFHIRLFAPKHPAGHHSKPLEVTRNNRFRCRCRTALILVMFLSLSPSFGTALCAFSRSASPGDNSSLAIVAFLHEPLRHKSYIRVGDPQHIAGCFCGNRTCGYFTTTVHHEFLSVLSHNGLEQVQWYLRIFLYIMIVLTVYVVTASLDG